LLLDDRRWRRNLFGRGERRVGERRIDVVVRERRRFSAAHRVVDGAKRMADGVGIDAWGLGAQVVDFDDAVAAEATR
jgi:hypothetical protein